MSFRPALMVHVVHREFLVRHEKKKDPIFSMVFHPFFIYIICHSNTITLKFILCTIFSTVTLNHTVVSHDYIGTLFRQCLYRL